MKNRILTLSSLVLLIFATNISFAFDLLPKPKKVEFKGEKISVGSNAVVVLPVGLEHKFPNSISIFTKTIKSLPEMERDLKIIVSQLSDITDDSIPDRIKEILEIRTEAYWIYITQEKIKIVGADLKGLLNGITTFEYFVKKSLGLSTGEIIDWPDHEIRAFHFVIRPGVKYEDAVRFLDETLRFGHHNVLIVDIHNWVEFESVRDIVKDFKRWNAKKGKWNDVEKEEKPWTKKQFIEFANHARGLGIEVIPGIKFLTHQEVFLQDKYPEFMFNNVTYDPRNERVYTQIVFPLLNEVIESINPVAIHIGHDEVAGHNDKSRKNWLRKDEKILPADLYLKDILMIHNFLSKRGIKVWIWGDMLVAKEEFPQMFPRHLHGNPEYIAIRTKLPKDIVICDWHYFDDQEEFPSAKLFAELGHKILGATWHKDKTIKNFSRYMAKLPKNNLGMIATTWFSVKNKGWEPLREIAAKSAEAFWNAE